MMRVLDPNAPTQEEIAAHDVKVAAHNMKVMKANLASGLCGRLCTNPGLANEVLQKPVIIANLAISMAEHILETYTLMPDAAGNKGGLIS